MAIIYVHTDSLCSLQIDPTVRDVRITIDCGGQCRPSSNFNYAQCDFISALGIEHCNQGQCESKSYNLSTCITTGNEINTIYSAIQNANCHCSGPKTTEQPQATTTTIVHRAITETAGRTDAQDISCNTKPLSSRGVQALVGALVGLVMVLLVMAIIPWIWICWKFKVNKGLKRDKQQKRYYIVWYIASLPCLCSKIYTRSSQLCLLTPYYNKLKTLYNKYHSPCKYYHKQDMKISSAKLYDTPIPPQQNYK